MARPKSFRPAAASGGGAPRLRLGLRLPRPGLRLRRPRRPHTWREFFWSGWFAYLVVLPAAAAVIVVAVVEFRGDSIDERERVDVERDRIELALLDAVMRPGFDTQIPASAEENPAGFGFFGALKLSKNGLFAPWNSYAENKDLARFQSWVEVDESFTGLGVYGSLKEGAATEAFARLREASEEDLLGILSQLDIERPAQVAGFERLPDPGLGDESFAYLLAARTPPFAGAPGQTVETTVIWSRVGASILFAARNAISSDVTGPAEIGPDPIDIEALAVTLAARLAAFDPEAVPPGPYVPPASQVGAGG